MPKHYKPARSVCNCTMEESECLPQGVLSFTTRRSLTSSVLKAAVFPLLVICHQQFLSDNNHQQRVFQLCEKLTSVSVCTYYSHLGLVEQLCFRSKRDCDSVSLHCQWKRSRSTELSGRFHTPGAEVRLYVAALCYAVVTSSRLRRCFDKRAKSSWTLS